MPAWPSLRVRLAPVAATGPRRAVNRPGSDSRPSRRAGTTRVVRAVLATLAVVNACSRPAPEPAPDPAPGVSLNLATERTRRIRALRYHVSFEIPAKHTEPVTGRVVLSFTLTDTKAPLVLDFEPGADAVTSVTAGSRPTAVRAVNGHLIVPAASLTAGQNVIDIAFRAGDAPLNRQPDLLYTLFVPARARLTFPCFDQPDLKARYTLELTLPAAWQSVANGAEIARSPAGDRMHVRYEETEPLPTYLFAFAAGRFHVETAERDGRTLRMFHRETDDRKVARNRNTIFDLHASALKWLEDYTAVPYPFGKFDFVLIPSFQFTGMEHPGSILYNASALLLDQSATENQLLNRANTIAHETAHMWFGDLVTMRWFDDVWMKEVFANFLAAKIANPSFPRVNHDLRFLVSHYPAAYAVDRTAGTHPIRQSLDNLADAGSQYGAIIYQKAPIVMRQLERLVGAEGLRDGLREYVKQFQFANATWLDLVRTLDARTDLDLPAWSRAWVEESGRPIVETELEVARDGSIAGLALRQTDPRSERQLRWTQRVTVLVGSVRGVVPYPIEVRGESTSVPQAVGTPAVRFVLPTGDGLLYGDVRLDPRSRGSLRQQISALRDPLARGATWVTLWEEVLNARLPPSEFIETTLDALDREDVEQNVALIIGYLRDAFWRYSSHAVRLQRAPAIERTLRQGLARARTPSAKATFFNGLRSMTMTAEGVAFLERVWARKAKVPGLTLAEADEATLALELAVRSVPNADAILATQLARFENPDRRDRFAFVMAAVSGSSATRQAFFDRLANVEHRRREPWVGEGLSYVNHPLRAEEGARYVRPALELLQEIQRTGDIFFPRNWMDSLLRGHGSPVVAETIRQFLDERPDYPVRLRRIILQSADEVFRAADILTERASSPRADGR